ncbi:hypothetical protein NE237_031575 [Protea cynaroides]|uniref:Protein kinase domain-containing protein n=1 Tax=Protea cynaroides TaxID=273540 RepID=A0A9Q0L1F3_9MAGN|nr:hypothetical protein NE237_031575 [Protea cynaroides]
MSLLITPLAAYSKHNCRHPKLLEWVVGRKCGYCSCNLRYDSYPFFDFLSLPPPSPTLAANNCHRTTTTDTIHGKGNGKFKLFVYSIITSAIVTSAIVVMIVAIAVWTGCYCYACGRNSVRRSIVEDSCMQSDVNWESLDFWTLHDATEGFSDSNKIGHGGCATVYKGNLNGVEIAVKRLSMSNRSQEMKTEMLVLNQCQHRNIVRLLGFDLEEQETLLVYEYLPNLSLDKYLFDPERSRLLNWERRHIIIVGIAQGLLYLHQDCQPMIIHRDLKASNVLLDKDMNPKISDFGLAKLLFGDQTHDQTQRSAGTYGYMAPEYASEGFFSIKSDVYAFGVLVLEIVTGQQILKFIDRIHNDNLLSFVWRHWTNRMTTELLDTTVRQSCTTNEVSRCIQLGLLCVQKTPIDRPTMSTVVKMLTTNSSLLVPSPPATIESQAYMQNDVASTSSELQPR